MMDVGTEAAIRSVTRPSSNNPKGSEGHHEG